MTDSLAPSLAPPQPAPAVNATPGNLTRANVLGKVPEAPRRTVRGRKSVKLSPGKKAHMKSLQGRGLISPRQAAQVK